MKKVTATISQETVQLLDGAIEAGVYAGRSDGVRTAIRSYLEANPEFRREVAVRLFEEDELDLLEATNLAGVTPQVFENEVIDELGEGEWDE